MSFDKDIKSFNDKVNASATKIFRGTALSLFGKVVIRTPVDTGRLRNNWASSINRPILQVNEGGESEGTEATVNKAKLGDSIFFTNNLPYAKAIEDGSSEQAPTGMVKVTVAEFNREVSKQAKANKL